MGARGVLLLRRPHGKLTVDEVALGNMKNEVFDFSLMRSACCNNSNLKQPLAFNSSLEQSLAFLAPFNNLDLEQCFPTVSVELPLLKKTLTMSISLYTTKTFV